MGARSPSGTNAGGLLETKQTYTNMADDDDDGEITLLDKCSEYLFDIFESNLTPEYQRYVNN